MRGLTVVVTVVLALGVGCAGDEEESAVEVVEAPQLVHTPPDGTYREGDSVVLEVTATDEDGVSGVTLYHRQSGIIAWETLYMEAVGDVWSAELEGLLAPGLEYYFKAVDNSEFELPAYLPADGSSGPFRIDVGVTGAPLPWSADFEDAEPGDYLQLIGWKEYAAGFEGYNWELAQARPHEGEFGVGHTRGPDGLEPLDDWLVSPPLDLSSASRVQVTWWEYGEYTENATHSLWVSTTSDDPTEGGFVEVAALDAPLEGEWSRSSVIELAGLGGEEVVYLAWRYEGQFADAWYLDDIEVQELGPDIAVTDISWDPDPVEPGESGVLTVSLANRTDVDMEAGSLLVTAPEGGVTFEAQPLAGLAGDDTLTVEVPFVVGESTRDNSYVPLSIEVAADTSWFHADQMVVGVPSIGTIAFSASGGLVEASVGYGDPDSPDLEVPVGAELVSSGVTTWEVDLTEHGDELPPDRGADRWWLRLTSETGGSLQTFSLAYDGLLYESDDLGGFPADVETLFYLPRPPAPEFVALTTTPTRVAPGDEVEGTVQLVNRGAATLGETTVTFTAADSHLTVTSGSVLVADGWASGQTVDVPITFSVSSDKVDSRPTLLMAAIEDEAESFDVAVDVEVPWPVFLITGVIVDDWSDGDNDGQLDSGESVNLEIQLTNVGDLDSFGTVSCSLSQTGGVASVTISEDSAFFGVVQAGETDSDDDFELTVDSGADGDSIELTLTCVDSETTYDAKVELVLGEPPWLYLSTTNDPTGDAVDGYDFDFVNGQYRCDGTTLQFLLESDVAIDESTLFLEMWGSSIGSPYTYYQVGFQSGKGTLRGYESGTFTKLSEPTITAIDAKHVVLELDVASMGLALDSLSLGFAAGFCGGDDYYCDHFPNAWGDPYRTGFYRARWIDLSW